MATNKNSTGQCCCDSDCCVQQIYICVCNQHKVLRAGGSARYHDLSECCEGCEDTPSLTVWLNCVEPDPPVIPPVLVLTLNWEYNCGATTETGTIPIDELCTPDTLLIDEIVTSDCTLEVKMSDQPIELDECYTPCEYDECLVFNNSYHGTGVCVDPGDPSGPEGGCTIYSCGQDALCSVCIESSVDRCNRPWCRTQEITATMVLSGKDLMVDTLAENIGISLICGGTAVFSVVSYSGPTGWFPGTSTAYGDGTYSVTFSWDSGSVTKTGGCTPSADALDIQFVGGTDISNVITFAGSSTTTSDC